MLPVEILIVGTNQPILATIQRLINKEDQWNAIVAYSVKEVIAICLERDIALLLIGAGLDEVAELELQQQLALLRPRLPVVKHYGGGSGLLFAEIYQAMAK